jgi:aspartyl-tRNA synthetase
VNVILVSKDINMRIKAAALQINAEDYHNDQTIEDIDLLYNGTEISTGAQREHRIDILTAQAKDKGLDPEELEFYLDFFRHGVPPHGGFGMGLARFLMLLLGLPSIRETTYLFRGPNRLLP